MMYLMRWGNGTADTSFVEVSSGKQDGKQQRETCPAPSCVEDGAVSSWCGEKLAAAVGSATSSSCIWRFPVWSVFCGKRALVCSGPVALPLVSLHFLWRLIFILKIFHSNYLVLKWFPEWFILKNGKGPFSTWELNSSTETIRLCVYSADAPSPHGGDEVTSTFPSTTADWHLQIQHGTTSVCNTEQWVCIPEKGWALEGW